MQPQGENGMKRVLLISSTLAVGLLTSTAMAQAGVCDAPAGQLSQSQLKYLAAHGCPLKPHNTSSLRSGRSSLSTNTASQAGASGGARQFGGRQCRRGRHRGHGQQRRHQCRRAW
jgi:hypothetical protein